GVATSAREVKKKAVEVLKQAGLEDADKRMRQFPHQFSGGMRQRVLIGIGLSGDPKLLIADEPTSALDVTVQRRILDHLGSLTGDAGTAVLFITHDLGLAAERAEKLIVMYKGDIVEAGPSIEVLQNPLHPYTQRLIAAAPSLASRRIQASDKKLGDLTHADQSLGDSVDLISAAEERAEHLAANPTESVIQIKDLTKVFKIRTGGFRSVDFTAVDKVSIDIKKGTTTALVGESGSGKSTVAKLLLGLEKATSGSISVKGRDITTLSGRELFGLRRTMQPVFQDPYGTLDPLVNIGNTIAEPL
ncbi:ABC transporter ATP-binding protein, partial [Schumannella luteola]